MSDESAIDITITPSGTGCVDCLGAGGWWFHLRRCVQCGHVGCCDTSPSQHASAHFRDAGHRYIQSFEPGEDWFWDFETNSYAEGPELAPPHSHPMDQPTPGPAGQVPADWEDHLNY